MFIPYSKATERFPEERIHGWQMLILYPNAIPGTHNVVSHLLTSRTSYYRYHPNGCGEWIHDLLELSKMCGGVSPGHKNRVDFGHWKIRFLVKHNSATNWSLWEIDIIERYWKSAFTKHFNWGSLGFGSSGVEPLQWGNIIRIWTHLTEVLLSRWPKPGSSCR